MKEKKIKKSWMMMIVHAQEIEEQVALRGDDDHKGKQVVLDSDVHHRSGDRVCEQCGKRFQNGKALGGHRKVHLNQSLLPQKNKALFKQKKKHGSSKGGSSSEVSCYVCKKDFPSIKSLHGHMRLHRERDWKGVRPPGAVQPLSEESKSSSYENGSDDDGEDDGNDDGYGDSSFSDHTIETDNDAAIFLVNWRNIEQRRRIAYQRDPNGEDKVSEFGRKKLIEESPVGYKGKPSSKNIKFDDGSKKITKEGSKNFGGAKPKKDFSLFGQTHKQISRKPQEFRVTRSDATLSDRNVDESAGFSSKYAAHQVSESALEKAIEKSPGGYKGNKNSEKSRSESVNFVPNKLSIGGKEKASVDDYDDDDDDDHDNDDENVDQTSWKISRKTQEFGAKYAERENYNGPSATSNQVLERAEEAEAVEHETKEFVCNICPSKFSTGQALGGHKRCHNNRVPVEEAPETAEVAPVAEEDGEITTVPEKLDLDLNQLPYESNDE
ncbi:protein PFC0760c [Pyrus x bretschneideri]|uniref:protein PFC0760c n=1 Tax=Pyrus x bretschneideri TaxID=225117 RepID=UPI00202DDD55|nr:protein PFC0760c [Pyrus x bretschneideri]